MNTPCPVLFLIDFNKKYPCCTGESWDSFLFFRDLVGTEDTKRGPLLNGLAFSNRGCGLGPLLTDLPTPVGESKRRSIHISSLTYDDISDHPSGAESH